jgi:hypothetical protein
MSPVSSIEQAAKDLDANHKDLKSIVKKRIKEIGGVDPTGKMEPDFDSFARGIAAIGDQVSLLQYKTAGKIDSIVYRAQQVGESIDRARSALTWPAKQAVERITSEADGLREQLLALSRDIGLYRVAVDTTLAGVLLSVPEGNTVGDLVKLNPRLITNPVVDAGTYVRHYVARIAA